tara:strand:- start:7238 stop:7582 length:345 start_codon:yes stop_codon:yes gene_type:complete
MSVFQAGAQAINRLGKDVTQIPNVLSDVTQALLVCRFSTKEPLASVRVLASRTMIAAKRGCVCPQMRMEQARCVLTHVAAKVVPMKSIAIPSSAMSMPVFPVGKSVDQSSFFLL